MSRASVLARARAFAAGGFTDTCTITRVASSVTNKTSGVITPTLTTVYSGPCRVQQAQAQATREDAGEASRLMVPRELQLPVATSTGIQADDTVTITAAPYDADLVGRVFTVREEMAKSHASARRLGIEEVTS